MRSGALDIILLPYKNSRQCRWCLHWEEDDPDFGRCCKTGIYQEGEEWCEKYKINSEKKARHERR